MCQLINDVLSIEHVQCREVKYILHNFHSDYKSRLVTLKPLPLMYILVETPGHACFPDQVPNGYETDDMNILNLSLPFNQITYFQ